MAFLRNAASMSDVSTSRRSRPESNSDGVPMTAGSNDATMGRFAPHDNSFVFDSSSRVMKARVRLTVRRISRLLLAALVGPMPWNAPTMLRFTTLRAVIFTNQ